MGKKDKKTTSKQDTGKTPKTPKSPAKTPKTTSEPVYPEIISETIVEYLHEVEGESPIDLCWENFIKIRAVPIKYENYDEVPLTLSLTNTAYNGTWPEGKKPYVTKGPLPTKYEFAQAHFHWGPDSKGGSDHDIEGVSLPFELHMVFYKASSGSLEDAKKEEDGIVTFCYMYKIHDADNDEIKPITDNIKEVTYAYSKKDLNPVPLISLFDPITEDYIVYLGFMKYKAVHGVTFIISRETNFISEAQLSGFRELKDRHENPMILKKREVQNYDSRNVFVVNPHSSMVTTVLHTMSGKRSKASIPTSHGSSRSQKAGSPTNNKRSSSNKNKSGSKRSSSKKGEKGKGSKKGGSPKKKSRASKRPKSKK